MKKNNHLPLGSFNLKMFFNMYQELKSKLNSQRTQKNVPHNFSDALTFPLGSLFVKHRTNCVLSDYTQEIPAKSSGDISNKKLGALDWLIQKKNRLIYRPINHGSEIISILLDFFIGWPNRRHYNHNIREHSKDGEKSKMELKNFVGLEAEGCRGDILFRVIGMPAKLGPCLIYGL